MKTFIVRIYPYKKDKRQEIVGTAEEAGKGKKLAFTNIDELWEILKSVKLKARELKYGVERRDEIRIEKATPCMFSAKKQNLKATIMNYSKHGLCLKIDKKIALSSKKTFHISSENSRVNAQAVWTEKRSDLPITMTGFKVLDGKLNLRDIKTNKQILIKG